MKDQETNIIKLSPETTEIICDCKCDECGKPAKVDLHYSDDGQTVRAEIHSCESEECHEKFRERFFAGFRAKSGKRKGGDDGEV